MSVENLQGEVWKVIDHPSIGYYPNYMVSNMGRVKSLNYRGNTGKERVLKVCNNTIGYLQAVLCHNGKIKRFYIHRLVAFVFLENPNNLLEINHLDEDKSNNCASNLCFCTRKQNLTYATRLERVFAKRRKKVYQYDQNYRLINIFSSVSEAGRNGFSRSAIVNCCNGKRNIHKNFIWSYEPIETSTNQLTLFPLTEKKIS